MQTAIRFKDCYHIELVEPDLVFLLSERSKHLLRGKIYYQIARLLLESKYSEEEIAEKLQPSYAHSEIYYGLERLKKKGHLEEAHSLSTGFAAFCQLLKLNPKEAHARLKKTKIAVDSPDELASSFLQEGLRKLGVQIIPSRSDADLLVVIVEDFLEERLRKINMDATKPWMIVKPYGTDVWIGPLFKPGEFPCWGCLEKRLEMTRVEESYIKNITSKKEHFSFFSLASLETNVQTALNLAVNEIFKWVVLEGESPLSTKILSLDFFSMSLQEHFLKGLEQCERCNRAELSIVKLPELQTHQKGESNDGGNRCRSPEYTWEKYKHHVSRLCGAVSTLEKINLEVISEIDSSQIHVYIAGHNFALSNKKTPKFYPKNMRDQSGGKGRSDMQAKVSGLCEALERFSCIYRKGEKALRASFEEIEDKAIDPRTIMLFSEEQYNRREELNKKTNSRDMRGWIPERIPENLEMDWSTAWSLKTNERKYIPTGLCYFATDLVKYIVPDSNGCAAGNCLEEAILQGFFEVVERDCVALWWYNCIQRPSVDIHSFKDPFFESLVEEYKKMGRTVWVLDITNDLNIPTFCALSKKSGQQEMIFFGFGTHLDPKIALSRALTEMNQWIWKDWKPNEDIYDLGKLDSMDHWLKSATVDNQPYLNPSAQVKVSSDYINQGKDNLLADIGLCQQICDKAGLEIFVVNLTRPEIGLSVAKVFVPNLRHFWARLAPGRLYDVPVKLGWLPKPLHESELNLTTMFL